jgi:hypothetical protein
LLTATAASWLLPPIALADDPLSEIDSQIKSSAMKHPAVAGLGEAAIDRRRESGA